ncbi:hypothetical protein BTO30_12370 [Domibacillus antri]|uniref:Uncharacterized protein n=1 Tax=Domibacillus antri TaxID=1714264 RepID=A0A1Q8Q3I7_9BACI|nr:hypothetical protein [Domibacillus antri]OLN21887.1 hypothetical protein BTO30_12370 [Domibacillus antri]
MEKTTNIAEQAAAAQKIISENKPGRKAAKGKPAKAIDQSSQADEVKQQIESLVKERDELKAENELLRKRIAEISPHKHFEDGLLMTNKNNREWLDSLNEEDTLLHLIGLIYHYDVGTIRDEEENFDESHWGKQRDDMLTFCEERLGKLLRWKKLKEWYGRRKTS